ncbi:MAG: BACON domain-containing protein [Bacteroidales bacterium]|nr:BACON domain-containing protein [Bacteroidales bacterium]
MNKGLFRTGWAVAVFAALFTLASCQETKESEEKIEITVYGLPDGAVHFSAIPASTFTIQVESTVQWTIKKTDLDWCTISPMNDLAGQAEVVFTAVPNETDQPREGQITITAGDQVARTVRVSQDAGSTDPFVVSGPENGKMTLSADAESASSFIAYAGTDWTASLEDLDWCTVTPLEGGRKQYVTLTLDPVKNWNEEPRSGWIVFRNGETPYARVEVVQEGFEPKITVAPESLAATARGQMETSVVSVTANADWTASASEEWVTLEPAAGGEGTTEVTVTVDVHEAYEERSATVTFRNKSAEATVLLTQAARLEDKLELDTGTLQFPNLNAQPRTVQVTSNTIWTVSTEAGWLEISPSSGNGDGSFSISAPDNLGPARSATLTVQAGTVTRTVSVSQDAGFDPAFFIDLLQESLQWTTQTVSPAPEPTPWDGQHRIYPDTRANLSWAEWTWNNGVEPIEYPEGYPGLDVYNRRLRVNRAIFDDDALVFTVPVAYLPASSTLVFTFALRGGSRMPAYWTAETCLDGKNWVEMQVSGNKEGSTGILYTGRDGEEHIAPVFMTKKDSEHEYQATLTLTEPLVGQVIQLRIRVLIARGISGSLVTKPENNSNVTMALPRFTYGGITYSGPNITAR